MHVADDGSKFLFQDSVYKRGKRLSNCQFVYVVKMNSNKTAKKKKINKSENKKLKEAKRKENNKKKKIKIKNVC